MKKLQTIVLLAAMLCLLAQAGNAQVKAGLRLYGGLNFLNGGDLNKGAEAWHDVYVFEALSAGYSSQGSFSPAHLGMNFGGEIVILFTPRIGLGLGAGYISASRTSAVEFHKLLNPTIDLSLQPKATVIPLQLSFYYFLPVASWMNIVLQAGPGFYLAKAYYHHRAENPTYFEEITIDTKANGLGFHGGVGFEFRVSSQLGLLVEFLGRYASVSGFEGEMTTANSGGSWNENGVLYLINAGFFNGLLVSSIKPSGPGVSSEEAAVDFSGFSFRGGFFIRF